VPRYGGHGGARWELVLVLLVPGYCGGGGAECGLVLVLGYCGGGGAGWRLLVVPVAVAPGGDWCWCRGMAAALSGDWC